MKATQFVLLLTIILSSSTAHSGIHKWVDENGQTHFGDSPPKVPRQNTSKKTIQSQSLPYQTNNTKEIENDQLKSTLRSFFIQKKYIELNEILGNLQAKTESDIRSEESLCRAYRTFNISTSSSQAIHDAWVQQTPKSYQAYLARAMHYYAAAWKARGGGWASNVSAQSMTNMRTLLGKADADITKVLEFNSKSLPAYVLRVRVYKTLGLDTTKILKKGLQASPASYSIRESYLDSITPHWGGSYEAMSSFAKKSQAYKYKNKKISLLQGIPYWVVADDLRRDASYKQAEITYNKALEYGENHNVYHSRGVNSYYQKNYKAALQDFDKANSLYPENSEHLRWISKTYSALEEHSKALKAIKKAQQINPFDSNVLKQMRVIALHFTQSGYTASNNATSKLAIENFTLALDATPEDADIYYRRSRVHAEEFNLDKAEKDAKKALQLDPSKYSYYVNIDWILAKRKKWPAIVKYWEQYLAINPDDHRALLQVGGTFFHQGNVKKALEYAKRSADLGNKEALVTYNKYKHLVN